MLDYFRLTPARIDRRIFDRYAHLMPSRED